MSDEECNNTDDTTCTVQKRIYCWFCKICASQTCKMIINWKRILMSIIIMLVLENNLRTVSML